MFCKGFLENNEDLSFCYYGAGLGSFNDVIYCEDSDDIYLSFYFVLSNWSFSKGVNQIFNWGSDSIGASLIFPFEFYHVLNSELLGVWS